MCLGCDTNKSYENIIIEQNKIDYNNQTYGE